MINTCYVGDVRDGLRAFVAAGHRARTCVTSPPYWGLRDYGHAGQIGLEPTPAEYVATLVDVFRHVRDALADDGTVWLNLGDSYNAYNGNAGPSSGFSAGSAADTQRPKLASGHGLRTAGLKPKDLVGIPWRVAFALQEDGWYLRSDVIWHKPNPMPESVTDRPTKAHEYLFLLAKSERYFYDAMAIAEPNAEVNRPQSEARREQRMRREVASVGGTGQSSKGIDDGLIAPSHVMQASATRNRRTVWTVATEPYSEAHFATFPTALIEPCVLAGSRPGDIVLDPFLGSGTTAKVAQSLGRAWFGCELNPQYAAMQSARAAQLGLVLA
jgi:DNA modification methylase